MANNVRAWSTTANNNGTADADINAAEGCPPSAVNDAERQMMAKLKNTLTGIEYLDHGHTATFASATTFASPGDLTAIYLARRRLKFDDASTLYGTIQSSSFVATNTTVTVVLDTGTTLTSALSAVYIGIQAPTNLSAPANFNKELYATTAGTSTAYTAAFTPKNVALTNGIEVRVKIHTDCGATPTLAVDGLTAKTIVKPGNVAVSATDMTQNAIVHLTYDSTLDAWVIIGAASVSTINQGRHAMWLDAAVFQPRATNGAEITTGEASTNKNRIDGLAFDQSTDEFAQVRIAPAKSWNEGTITFKPYWRAASGTGDVIWGMRGVAAGNDDLLDVAFGTAQTSTDTLIATTDLHVGPESSAITIAGSPAAEDLVWLEIYRDADAGGDTLNADAILMGVMVYWTIDAATDT